MHCIYDGFANVVVSPAFKRFPPSLKVLRYPIWTAGLRFWDLRRYGRNHRKMLVVDEEVAFLGGYNIGSAYATEWRDTHVRITGPGVWDLKRAFADFWNLNRRHRLAPQRAAAAARDGVRLGPADPDPPQHPAAVELPDPQHVPRGDQPRQPQHLAHHRLLPARPGLRRRARRGGAARASTYASCCR